MSNKRNIFVLISLLSLPFWYLSVQKLTEKPPILRRNINLQEALSDGTKEFAEVHPGREFSFPEDHGEHPEFKTEWWYFTGNLRTTDSSDNIGYQLTIFARG